MTRRRTADKRLRTLERWKTLELDEARVERAVADEAVARVEAAVDALEREMQGTREAARALMSADRPLSADDLRRVHAYGAWQESSLAERRNELEGERRRADRAGEAVRERFVDLSSIERLRERGERERALEERRDDQKQLDAQGLLRLESTDR